MKECIIIGAGEVNVEKLYEFKNTFMIAADGGYVTLIKIKKEPNVLIGDFDSLEEAGIYEKMLNGKGFEIYRLPCEKEDTDILAAIKYALKLGYDQFHLFGGTGDRVDHMMANVQCLVYLANLKCKACLYGKDYEMSILKNGTLEYPADMKGTISVLCMSESARGVTLEGLKYPLDHVLLKNDFPVGVSNEFIGQDSRIIVEKGTLLIIRYYEKK